MDAKWDRPDDFSERYGPWALIAGGSEGTGEAFARRIAGAGINLVLLARRQAPLDSLAADLQQEYAVDVRTVSIDLTDYDAAEQTAELTAGLDVGLVVFNAGATVRFDRFIDWPLEDLTALVRMNCLTTTALAHFFGPRLVARGRGGFVLIGSMAGFAGSAHQSVYNASKAFDWVFAEGLWRELGSHGVDALAVVLGATDTPAHRRMGADLSAHNPMDPSDVAHEALANLHNGPTYIVGEQNRAALGFLLSSDRGAVVSLVSDASAQIGGSENPPMAPRLDRPAPGGGLHPAAACD